MRKRDEANVRSEMQGTGTMERGKEGRERAGDKTVEGNTDKGRKMLGDEAQTQ